MRFIDIRMHDGSRHFVSLPESVPWSILRDHIALLDGSRVTNFITDYATEAWIDFEFADHTFTVNNQCSEYWFFVDDPSCPNEILEQVTRHCARLLGPQKHQFSLRTLFVAVILVSIVLAMIMSGVRWHREQEGIIGALLAFVAFCGFFSALQQPAHTEFFPKRVRSSVPIISTVLGGWFSLVPLSWLSMRYKPFVSLVPDMVFVCLFLLAFLSVMMSWLGLFQGVGLLFCPGQRRGGLARIGICLVPLGAAGLLFGLVGVR